MLPSQAAESALIKSEPILAMMARRLASRSPIDDADRDAIHALPHKVRTVDASAYLIREGALPERCPFLVSGFAFRQKLTSDGARQILALQIPGDFIDLQNLFLKEADHNVQALTRAEVADIPIEALRELALTRPAIAKAMWVDALVDASIAREWIVNVGRRDARSRVAHLLTEFAVRLFQAGLGEQYRYELPITQEQLADATGLTPVHINRVLKSLADEGLIQRGRRQIGLANWRALGIVGDFTDRFLHLDQTGLRYA